MSRGRTWTRPQYGRLLAVKRGWITLAVCLLLALAQAQAEVQQVLERGRELVEQAKVSYAGTVFSIDQPLWREAVAAGEEALKLAPEHPEALRFLAQVYGQVGWYIRAWDHWLRYIATTAELSELDREQVSQAGGELGFARYQAGDLAGALTFYQQVFEINPTDNNVLTWLGRIHLERGEPEQALAYWELAVERGLPGATYFRERTQSQLDYGVAASDSFFAGIEAYEEGRFEAALEAFRAATELNPDYLEAWVWAGRSSLELGRSAEARRYWQHVLARNPDDARARHFIAVADAQERWGVEAANAFFAGIAAYEAGRLAEAVTHFRQALSANPRYQEAAVWTARSYQELGDPQRAIPFWEQVLALNPQDARAAHFLQLARNQVRYGAEAASAFAQGVERYQLAQLQGALAAFRQAVAENPRYLEAWAWLGRVYFELGDYAEAAAAYEQALALAPDNEAFHFFANEARRLAGLEPRQ